tara:strand:+ start:521 stop:2047 length:1527 start_codon:yes stop_codon:yes gene_type:complete
MGIKISLINYSKISSKFTQYSLFLMLIIFTALVTRFYFFPFDVPITSDALNYFWFSSDIYQIGKLPTDWSLGNNGWPILVSIIFFITDSKDVFTLMEIQKMFSVLISISTTIPVYFLCKKFVQRKFALIGASIIAFDPRLMINSFLGVTDPLFLLLISTSLVLFLYSNKKNVYLSFVIVALAALVRTEGIAIFLVLSIMFFIKYRKENYKLIFKYLLILGIFGLILLPLTIYRIDVTGDDYLFQRGLRHMDQISSDETYSDKIFEGLKIFSKYLIWVLIPNFIIFIPFGIFLIFRKLNIDKITIILSLVILSLPALYGYTLSALDTRYLYVLFPMFCVLAVLPIEKFSLKFSNQNIVVIIIILSLIIVSIGVYDYLKIDYEHEKEAFEIMKDISNFANGINEFSTESRYMYAISAIDQWPQTFQNIKFNVIQIEYDVDSLEHYILNSKSDGLTHLVVDQNEKRPKMLQELFINEEKFDYLKKVYDSKNKGFNYHVKVFEINYELMEGS